MAFLEALAGISVCRHGLGGQVVGGGGSPANGPRGAAPLAEPTAPPTALERPQKASDAFDDPKAIQAPPNARAGLLEAPLGPLAGPPYASDNPDYGFGFGYGFGYGFASIRGGEGR